MFGLGFVGKLELDRGEISWRRSFDKERPMTRMTIRSRVGADGILRVAVPVGVSEADAEMNVTIEPVSPRPMTQAEYVAFIDSLAGAWEGDFERPPQGEPEEREPFP